MRVSERLQTAFPGPVISRDICPGCQNRSWRNGIFRGQSFFSRRQTLWYVDGLRGKKVKEVRKRDRQPIPSRGFHDIPAYNRGRTAPTSPLPENAREVKSKMKKWLYDEFKHCGVDYSDVEQAEGYDERHGKFRDYGREFKEMMAFLDLRDTKDKTVVDLGCGTGALSISAAGSFKTVYAVDVSKVMIEKARRKLDGGVHNVRFVNAGFLSYEHEGEPADLVVTKAALHHLPDFWKQIALMRINRMLKMHGILYIHDVVFQFDPREYIGKIDSWISGFEKIAGGEFRAEVETHIRDEYSTFGWIMDGMLEKAGFAIDGRRSADGFVTEYACRKVREFGDKPPFEF